MFLSEQDIRYGVISALACVGGVEIAAAYVRIDYKIFRCICNDTVIDVFLHFLDFFQSFLCRAIH